MRFRPNQVFKDFTVEEKSTDVSTRGRNKSGYEEAEPPIIVNGALADATPDEKERWKQMQHPITHTIVQQGPRKAKESDRLVLDGRHFYIQGIENPGNLDMWTLYRVEERRDA